MSCLRASVRRSKQTGLEKDGFLRWAKTMVDFYIDENESGKRETEWQHREG